MAPEDVRCVLVKIHGIGQQLPTWSTDFDSELGQKLATLTPLQQAAVVNESVYWADLSTLSGAGSTAGVAAAPAPVGPAETAYAATRADYTHYLTLSVAAAMPTTAAPSSIISDVTSRLFRLRDGTVTVADHVNDIANYVSNNAIRLAVQRRLTEKLATLQDTYPNASLILGSHSQGTIISYDVLRLEGDQLPRLTTWVTMGCPLGWYLTFGRWGADRLGIRPAMTWLNYYDPADIVGKTLAELVSWQAPVPQDTDVNNTGAGLDAHDHWHNPAVVDRYFQLIQQALL